MLGLFASCSALAQNAPLPEAPKPQNSNSDTVTLRKMPVDILRDQEAIWTSPARIRARDLKWLIPIGLATGAAVATDRRALHDFISLNPSFNSSNTNASNVLIGGFIATPVLLYGVGRFTDDEHARETGLLGAESLLDGVVVEQGMKLIFWRERPQLDAGRGRFFQTSAGVDSSFPSSHSVLAWATASAIATEYPHTWTRILVYSGATGVSLTRLMGQQHFPSDVLVGSAAGWLIGRYVVHHHHRWHTPISR
jgi:membrane-associated phospholipid phosphatase